MNRPSVVLTALILGSGLSALASESDSADKALTNIEAELKTQWLSIDTLAMDSREYFLADDGSQDQTKFIHEYSLRFNSNGQRSIKYTAISPNGEKWIADEIREDGKKRHQLVYDKAEGTLLEVKSQMQTDDKNHYTGPMFAGLWFLCPAGSPPIEHLKNGGKAIQADGMVNLTFLSRNRTIECKVDPLNDFITNSVLITIGARTLKYTATGIGNFDGRKFPKSGKHETIVPNGSVKLKGFEITRFDVNRPINSDSFACPKIMPGMIYTDQAGMRMIKEDRKSLPDSRKSKVSIKLEKEQSETNFSGSKLPYAIGAFATMAVFSIVLLKKRYS